ncbi:MAG TPA: hypothetical protein VGG85_20395 [Terracidiphilus sp.]|jgi:hypothetical protein
MIAIESVLAGLIDYAGLYPPAHLEMHAAVRNYLAYRRSPHACALGRFVVDLDRVDELRATAGDRIPDIKLSVLATPKSDWKILSRLLQDRVMIEAVESKASSLADIERIIWNVPRGLEIYLEVPNESLTPEILDAMAALGAHMKLRMGGVVAAAFPGTDAVVSMLVRLNQHRVACKATAGLHHPIRSHHPYTYAHDSPAGAMHGFVNLICAAALIHFGGDSKEAKYLLDEQDVGAFDLTERALSWRSHNWTVSQLNEVREKFLISFGACSFEEPIHDLETMGWL